METFTVYESKTSEAYRIVAGKHVPHTDIERYTARVYQGSTLSDAAHAAHSAETRRDIRSQIARFFELESPASRTSAIARELAAMEVQPVVHEFATSEAARDDGARSDNIGIRHGDILVIPSEQVVGIACGEPFAVTAIAGDLSQLGGSIMHALDGRGITAAYLRAACNEAARRGYLLSNWAYAFREV